MRSRKLRNLMIGLAVFCYALIFGEAFMRLMKPQAILPRYVTATPAGIRGNIPDSTYYHYTPEVTVEMRINSQGLRADREFAPEPAPGTCRVAILGDSFFMGYEADLPESIAGQIESQFAEAGYRVEVLNFAVSGFGTAEMLRKYEQEVVDFAPDILVYQFHGSDFTDNIRAGLYRLSDAGRVEDTGAIYVPAVGLRSALASLPAYRWISDNSHLHAFVRQRTAVQIKRWLAVLRGAGGGGTPSDDTGARASSGPSQAELLTSALVAETYRRAENAGTEWFLFEIPGRRSRTRFDSSLNDLVVPPEVLARTISPLEAFRAAADDDVKLYWEQGHGHLTPLGNRIATEVLLEGILSRSAGRMQTCRSGSS